MAIGDPLPPHTKKLTRETLTSTLEEETVPQDKSYRTLALHTACVYRMTMETRRGVPVKHACIATRTSRAKACAVPVVA